MQEIMKLLLSFIYFTETVKWMLMAIFLFNAFVFILYVCTRNKFQRVQGVFTNYVDKRRQAGGSGTVNITTKYADFPLQQEFL